MALEINSFEVMKVEIASNKKIKEYRESLNLPTKEKTVDAADIRYILYTLNEMGFSVVRDKVNV
jgi:hypothetical protein